MNASMLAAARALHDSGNFAEAHKRYESILDTDPDNHEVLHLLGVCCLQDNDFVRAEKLISRAISIHSKNPIYYSNLANALHKQNKGKEALSILSEAIDLFPRHADSYYNRGIIFASESLILDAKKAFLRAIEIDSNHAAARYNLGNAHLNLKEYKLAIDAYKSAIKINANYAKAWYNAGKAWRELDEHENAVNCFTQAVKIDPTYSKAFYNRGNALQSLKRHSEAIADYNRCLELRPDDDVAMLNKGNALLSQRKYESAVTAYEQAISVKPDVAAYHNNKGNAFLGMRQTRKAIDAYGQAISVDPLEKDAHFNRAICYLLTGELELGFQEYEWRWLTEDMAATAQQFEQPLFTGEQAIAGKRVLLHCEQGLGDTIQFVRYAKKVSELGGYVILVVQPPLINLMRGLDGGGELVAHGAPIPKFDFHCPLLSLPHAFRTSLKTIPSTRKYIYNNPELVQSWSKRLGEAKRPRIGLAWSGRKEHKNDENRSIKLETLLVNLPKDYTYICLQKELRGYDKTVLDATDNIRYFGDELNDFSDTAAICENLDLVITVDTSIAHMSAAIGKPTWILLPFIPDWRWMLDRDDSPWYPTVRLFRQDEATNWHHPLKKIEEELKVFQFKRAPKTNSNGREQESFISDPGKLPILLNWQAGRNFGWGILGMNIFSQWACSKNILPLLSHKISRSDVLELDPLRFEFLKPSISKSNHFCEQYIDEKSTLNLSFPLIDPLGNGLVPRNQWRGLPTIGRCIFEDTDLKDLSRKLSKYDFLLTGSTWNKALLQSQTEKHVELIFEGVDVSIFNPGSRSGIFPRDRFYVFSGGKIEYRKAQDLVIRAFKIFSEKHNDAVLVTAWHSPFEKYSIGFKGTLTNELKATPDGNSADISNWVLANGIVPDNFIDLGMARHSLLPQVLREMDCAIQVSRAEACTNLPAKEAMACGVPVILARNTGMADLITNDNCMPIPANKKVESAIAGMGTDGWGEADVDEIVDALEILYSDTQRRKTIGQTASEWIISNKRTWSDHSHKLGEIVLSAYKKATCL